MKRFAIMLTAPLLLTGCTDIRTRLSPDILAIDLGETVQLAAHTSQDDAVIRTAADSMMLLPEALRAASGAEISTGHLSMLAVSGNPCAVTEQYLQTQWLAPTCAVLFVPQNACTMLEAGALPSPEEIQAAVDTGLLPNRTADTVIGDLQGGSGVTALTALQNGELTLALWDSAQFSGYLSQDACRGLALLGTRWESFAYAVGKEAFRVQHAALTLSAREDDRLHFTVSGTVRTEPPMTAAARDRLSDMLAAAMQETVCERGADLLFLRETALRDGIASAKSCTQAQWRALLCASEYEIRISGG